MNTNDIICAISTAAGTGAIAIIRLSGKGCIELTDRIFKHPKDKKLKDMQSHTIHWGQIINKHEIIDEVLVSIFQGPHSFTGEDSIEISCHGSIYIQQRLLKLLIDTGARLAKPGEFTQRAFLNGKIDLLQAEAIADLISSSSEAAHRMAIQQMRGGFSKELQKLRSQLLHIASLLELELDFSEEDVEFADRDELIQIISNIKKLLTHLCNSFNLGNVLKNGVPVAIIGNTNVGKSTLLNTLLQEERAIVSNIAGTTRDTIEDTVNIEGIIFRFIDTAGIRQTTDEIENIGIERTFSKIKQASIVLLMTDLRNGIDYFKSYYTQIKQQLTSNSILIILLNKIDINKDLQSQQEAIQSFISKEKILSISARSGYNIEQLKQELVNIVQISSSNPSDIIVNNIRHYEALQHALQAVLRIEQNISQNVYSEFISQDIRECLHYLGEITGEISTDEILNNIFKNFCIGK